MLKNIIIFFVAIVFGLLCFRAVIAQEIDSFETECANVSNLEGTQNVVTGDFSGTITQVDCKMNFEFMPHIEGDTIVISGSSGGDGACYYPDIECYTPLITSEAPFTVQAFYIQAQSNGDAVTVFCDDESELYTLPNPLAAVDTYYYMNFVLHCDETVYFAGNGLPVNVLMYYIPYDTRTGTTTNPTNRSPDTVFGLGIIIFILATIFGTYMKSIFKKKKWLITFLFLLCLCLYS